MKQKIVIIVFAIIVASFIFLYVPRLNKHESEPCLGSLAQQASQEVANER